MMNLRVVKMGLLLAALFVSAHAHANIEVTDFYNRKVVLSQPAKRVIALAPHIVENIASAGGLGTLVGVVDYCDYPEQAKTITHVGNISQFSLEKIIALKPDLVVVWMSTKGGEMLEKLESYGIKTYASDPHKLEDVAKAIRDYGKLFATSETAEAAASQFEIKLANLKQNYSTKKSVSVFYEVWYEPLQTLNDQHIVSDVMRLCGAANAFGDAPVLAPKINIETVIARDPDIIIASGMGEARPDWLDLWRNWPMLKAVKNNHLYFVPPDLIQRHTARILDGAEIMCKQIDAARTQ